MVYKQKGWSPYTQQTNPPGPNSKTDNDQVSGRTQVEEIEYDIEQIKKSIGNPNYSPEIVKKLRESLKQNQEALIRIQKAK